MKVKRILIFSLAYYPSYVSGAEAAIKEITNRIDKDDIEFEMITLRFDKKQPKTEQIENVLVHRIGFGSMYLSKIMFIPLAVFTALKLHKKNKFDAMWALMTYMTMPLVGAYILGMKIPYLITLQDGDAYEKVFERWFIRPITPLIDYGFRHATVIQAISNYLSAWPKKRGSEVPVELINNGGNPNDFKSDLFSKSELMDFRAKLGVTNDEILIGNTARLVYQKGWEDLISALKFLPKKVKLLVVGGGPDEGKYKDLVSTLKLKNRVIFTGNVDRSEVTKYRRILDIFVMPSRSEGLGNAGISARASKIPVISTQVGGLADYVFDAKRNPQKPTTGWAVDPDSPKQIAEAVMHILNNPEEVKKVTEEAYDMVCRLYTWDSVAKSMQKRVFARLFKETVNNN